MLSTLDVFQTLDGFQTLTPRLMNDDTGESFAQVTHADAAAANLPSLNSVRLRQMSPPVCSRPPPHPFPLLQGVLILPRTPTYSQDATPTYIQD